MTLYIGFALIALGLGVVGCGVYMVLLSSAGMHLS
jgi:hypothetical protein